MDILKQLSQELNLPESQVSSAVQLMDQGNTIPFIARYRKEATGSLDDQVLRRLQERLEYLRSLEKRREDISSAIQAQEKLTPELETAISAAATLTELEDIYRPFRPKRKTRASAARERGLEPLAAWIFSQQPGDPFYAVEPAVQQSRRVYLRPVFLFQRAEQIHKLHGVQAHRRVCKLHSIPFFWYFNGK